MPAPPAAWVHLDWVLVVVVAQAILTQVPLIRPVVPPVAHKTPETLAILTAVQLVVVVMLGQLLVSARPVLTV